MPGSCLTLSNRAIAAKTGRGVRVAVVDSGIAAGHPHVGAVAAGVSLVGATSSDFGDRLGHGTAVAAAIREKAPGCELLAVRVFDRDLTARADHLTAALAWAADHGAHIINLSLGTPNEKHRDVLREAVARATASGALVVAACEHENRPMFPGALEETIGVRLDASCARDAITLQRVGQRVILGASAYPRPIPGVPPERNLYGISFAVANAAAIVARLLQDSGSRSAAGVLEQIAASAA